MSAPDSNHVAPRRVFGVDDSAVTDDDAPAAQPRPGRLSFARFTNRPSWMSNWRSTNDEENAQPGTPQPERPPIPSALQQASEAYSTPLPKLSMIVLSIVLLGEFLTANVSMPFLLFMVEGFGEFSEEADVGFWTGILVATFFLTQFLTSMLWATIANRHGQRLVLLISLLGSSLTCALFGTATTLRQAMVIRLMQGIFAGAIGVARGSVAFVTDPSNEGRAYAILGFCWGLGGVAGAIVGGAFESPAKKWPSIFASVPLFNNYPYLLPCIIAASVTLIGAILTPFLGPDGGPRQGAIRLPPEKPSTQHPTIPEESPEASPLGPSSPLDSPFASPSTSPAKPLAFARRVSRRLSGYFARRVHDAHAYDNPDATPSVPLATSVPIAVPARRTSRANGSAYGYSAHGPSQSLQFRRRLASGASYRRGSMSSTMRRRGSNADGGPRSIGTDGGADLNFAQRLLMANENAVTNIADLWVAAAMNVDGDVEDVFESDTELEDEEAQDGAGVFATDGEDEDDNDILDTPTKRGKNYLRPPSALGPHRMSFAQHRSSQSGGHHPSISSVRRPSTSGYAPNLRRTSGIGQGLPSGQAFDSMRRSSAVPSIFAHPGVRTPPAVLDAQKLLATGEDADLDAFSDAEGAVGVDGELEKPPSLLSQLPMMIIIQYGLLALHSTTHDMVFLSYLVSKYESGGLNLNAGHFSQLTALMCLAQIAYQFYLYPNIGPPRGRFSHLAMFRLGSLLFIPAYLTVVLYRAFASAEDDGNFILMSALALSTAVRYCGSTFAYTSVSILLNYMSPPPVVSLANGLAQSIVSLARCFGPILGGYLWSVSVEHGPSGYYIGFFVCGGACAAAILHSLFIR
ncbi:major facilitator superfamily MFS-1 [Dentipellis sp. KUC8613]|nr:major facilitator superfamily MFS-1 [Dentipellis sp. KUC8613]